MKKHFLITAMFVMNFLNMLEGTNSNPTMSKIYGNQFTPQVEQTQISGAIGTLVSTEIFGINGSLSLAVQVPNAQAVATTVLSTGVIAVLFSDGTNGYVLEYMADGSVNGAFAAGTGNILTLPNLPNGSPFMLVDEQDRLVISGAGYGLVTAWMRRITPQGTVDTTFNFTDGASWGTSGIINQLGTQTLGQIVAVGFNGTNAMIARYNLNGSVDTSFGTNGYVIFDGLVGGLPTVTVALKNVVIDAQNNLYIAYLDATPSVYVTRLTSSGAIDQTWNSGNPVHLSYLDGASMQTDQLSMILDSLGDLVVAIPLGSPQVIKAASIASADGTAGTFANFITSGGVFGSDNYLLLNMMTTSEGSIYFVGSDLTSKKMAIIRCTSAGILDTTFNDTGINFFYPAGSEPSLYALINAGAIAPDGQIFVAGAQLHDRVTTAYLSSLYNNQYVNSVLQFPQTQEQGTTDILFGDTTVQTSPGVVSPFYGLYRSNLEQKMEAVTELASGNILAGMQGYLGTSPALSNIILVRLLPTGELDPTFGFGGKLVLPNLTETNEYITSILEDGEGNFYVTGYSDLGAIFRKYGSNGFMIWNSDYLVAGYQGLGSGFQGLTRALLFLGGPDNTGQINGYLVDTGEVDITFHNLGSTQGELLTTDYSLNMGSLSNGIVDSLGNIYVAYKNTSTHDINVSCIYNAAASVVWTASDIFASEIDADNVRVAFNNDGNIVVAVSVGANFLISILHATTGQPISTYTSPLTITCGTDIQLKQLIGISDNTIVLVGYDGNGEAMLATRATTTGTIDTTFDSQGPIPGVASLIIGRQITNYFARVASGITVQSHAGSNQGNLIMSGYEQLYATDATPMVMRVFGEPGTTQVKTSPIVAQIPGTPDLSYDGDGIAETYVLGASTPAANQEVRAIRQLIGTQIMTVVTDNNTSISYTQRLNSDSSLDTTYGNGLGIPIVKMSGTEVVQSMQFDGAGNFLITGSNSISGGYVKRLLPTGSVDTTFGGYTGSQTSSTYPLGTAYGLMSVVNACQQLTNGNIVIVGFQNGVGMIQMLSSTGSLVTTFGSGGQVTNGANITSVSVDPSNNIYVSVSYSNGSGVSARILKLNAAGQLVTSFGSGGIVDNAIASIDNSESLRLVFDQTLRPIIAASSGGSSGFVVVNRFNPDGSVDTTFNGGIESSVLVGAGINIMVTSMVALQSNQTLISGYQQGDNYEFIICINSLGILDSSFGVETPGLVKFQASETLQLAHRLITMNVQTNGNILLCGGDIPVVDQETPLTFRFYGYPNVQPVPQFTGYQPIADLPNVLNLSFNQTGIAQSPAIDNLLQLGDVVTDSLNRGLIGGVTSTGLFVVARYLKNGLLDTIANGGTGFGVDGIATSTTPITGLAGGKIAIDSYNRVYIGGASASDQLLVARFTSAGVLDTTFASDGIAASIPILNLFDGAFITVDHDDRPLVSGYTATGNVVATRFNTDGTTDINFASTTSYIASIPVTSLLSGGSIAIDNFDDVVLGGQTSTGTMFVIKLNFLGLIDPAFGDSLTGIAYTPVITGLVDAGKIAVDSNNNIAVGGLTANQQFVVAKFTTAGILDPLFNAQGAVPGIVYSNPVNILNIFGNIAIDTQNNIICGGVSSNNDGSKSMIAARFTPLGILDTVFSSVGMATTGSIPHLVLGGFVETDVYDNIFIGGLSDLPGFIMAQMYSGYEIFIPDPAILIPQDLKTYYYGNNTQYLLNVLSIQHYAQVISDPLVKADVISNVLDTIATYVLVYSGQPGWNLVWHFYRELDNLDAKRAALVIVYPSSTDEINSFFAKLQNRINSVKYVA